VPRVLGLSTVNGKTVPTMHYQSTTTASDVWTDSGSVTIQDDSLLVVRTYGYIVSRGASTEIDGTPFPYTISGRLTSDGLALFRYSDGTVDTARVLSNGAVSVQLSISDGGSTHAFGTFLFAAQYRGGTLNPMPFVRAITPDSVPQFADSAVVTFTGSSFAPGVQAIWGGTTPLAVKYLTPYQFTAVIPKSLLLSAGAHTISVVNPGPGGGTRIYGIQVVVPEPAIMSVVPTAIVAEGGDFRLLVHGRGFTQGTVVLWNGSPMQGTLTGTGDLVVYVPNSAITSAGTVQIAVQTPPPGGGTSGYVPFTITGPPAQKLGEVLVPIHASALLADPVRSLVYAVTDGSETTYKQSVVAIDPISGNVQWTIPVGGPPGAAAIADDGAYLYVAAPSDSIIRIALATHAVDLSIPLPLAAGLHAQATALAVMPGHSHTIAVVRTDSLEIYDDAQRRPQTVWGQRMMIGFSSAQALHGLYLGSLSDFTVSSTGVTLTASDVAHFQLGVISFSGTGVYDTFGETYELTTHTGASIQNFPPIYAVVPSSDHRMLYTSGEIYGYVRGIDIATGLETGAVSYKTRTPAENAGTSMVRWGADGLAFTANEGIYFIRASFVH